MKFAILHDNLRQAETWQGLKEGQVQAKGTHDVLRDICSGSLTFNIKIMVGSIQQLYRDHDVLPCVHTIDFLRYLSLSLSPLNKGLPYLFSQENRPLQKGETSVVHWPRLAPTFPFDFHENLFPLFSLSLFSPNTQHAYAYLQARSRMPLSWLWPDPIRDCKYTDRGKATALEGGKAPGD